MRTVDEDGIDAPVAIRPLDPELMMRMLIVGYIFVIPSERRET